MKSNEIMQECYHLLGKRVELISTTDNYTTLKYGDLGIVDYIDDAGTIFVSWDNGSKLGLIPGVDIWKLVLA